MKKLITALLAFTMLFSSIGAAMAQDAPSAVATGFDSTATYMDSRGREVATMSVTGVVDDWDEYDSYYGPERGSVYRAVEFTVTNISGGSMIIRSYDFSLIDATGRNISTAWVQAAETAETELFSDDVPLADGESADLVLVFETLNDVDGAALVWQPEYGILVLVQFGGDDTQDGSFGHGFGGVATWTDDRGNPVGTLVVNEIEADWMDYDQYSQPERGQVYKAVHFTVTNVSSSSLIIGPYDFTLLDNGGVNNSRAWATASADTETVLFDNDVPLAPGESYEGVMIFSMYDDLEPVAVIWQPEYSIYNVVILTATDAGTDGSVNPLEAATPAN
ncbi:MAG: DUF4352 domain-containing protein [Thermomicrobiales bacterium]|nr:DUF4352 domain-containing protein [Thermomicrobiales bacterium]